MLSKSQQIIQELKRSSSIIQKQPASTANSESKFNGGGKNSVLASAPFRSLALATDGYATVDLRAKSLADQNMSVSDLLQNYTSSSLSGSYYTNGVSVDHNGDTDGGEDYSRSKSNLIDSLQRMASISSSDYDFELKSDVLSTDLAENQIYEETPNHIEPYSSGFEVTTQEKPAAESVIRLEETNVEMNQNVDSEVESVRSGENIGELASVPVFTLPTRFTEDSSGLKKYAIRRHHSAPQSDLKWFQVFDLNQFINLAHKIAILLYDNTFIKLSLFSD